MAICLHRVTLPCLWQAWEWCIAHLLNCALVEAFGTTLDIKACRNKHARQLITLVKNTIENVNKSSIRKVT